MKKVVVLLLAALFTTVVMGQSMFSTLDIVKLTVTPVNGSPYTLYPRGTVKVDSEFKYIEVNNGANYGTHHIVLTRTELEIDNSVYYYHGYGRSEIDAYIWIMALPTNNGDYYLFLQENDNTKLLYKLRAKSVTTLWE